MMPKHRRRLGIVLPMVLELLERTSGLEGPKYVQIGANDGVTADPIYPYARTGRWRGLLIEPAPLYYERLKQLYAANPKISTLNLGISDEPGEMELHYLAPQFEDKFPQWARGCASLQRETALASLTTIPIFEDHMVISTRVRLERLDHVGAEHTVFDADLMLVDVEGHERKVFESFDFALFRPKVVYFESKHMPENDRQAIKRRLQKAGYELFQLPADILAVQSHWMPPSFRIVFAELGARSVG
ncbi:MAG: FkbM family methyltransferase [Pseudomonadota bacterium]